MKKEQRKPTDLKQLLGFKEPPDRGGKKKPALKKTHFTIWYFVIAFLIIIFIQNYFVMKKTEDVISYSEFKEALRANKIKDITITPETIFGERETEKGPRKFSTVRVEDSDLVKELEATKIKYTGKVESKWLMNIFTWVFPVILLVFFWRFLLGRIGPKRASCRLERAGLKSSPRKIRKSPGDVAGIDEAKEELKEVVEFPKLQESSNVSVEGFPKEFSSSGCRERGKHCWLKRSPGKPMSPSSLSAVLILWRCLSEWELPGSGTSLLRLKPMPPVSSSSTNSMPWERPEASIPWEA
jgi:cell division protease FtsH